MRPRMDSRPRRLFPKHRTRLWEEALHASLPAARLPARLNRPRPLSTALQQACHAEGCGHNAQEAVAGVPAPEEAKASASFKCTPL